MKASRRITISVLTLVLTVIALGTITFAWFSLSTVSNVSNISGTVRGGEGLEVRLVAIDEDGKYFYTQKDEEGTLGNDKLIATDWKSNLTTQNVEDFIEAATAEHRKRSGDFVTEAFNFNAVSTTNGSDYTKMLQVGDNSVVNGQDAVLNIDYLQFKIEFRSPTDGTVKLTSYELTGSGTVFTPDVNYLQTNLVDAEDSMLKVTNDPSNGARFSLTEGEDVIKAYQKAAAEYEIIGDITGNTANNAPVEHGQYSYLTTGKSMILYYGESEIDDDFTGIEMLTAADTLTAANKPEITLVENTEAEGTSDAYIASTILTIWIEGWDADTYDAFYLGQLVVNLTFTKDLE